MTHLPGKFVWFQHASRDVKKAQAFYGEVLGWKVERAPMGDSHYDMIQTPEGPIGGYGTVDGDGPAHWISYLSVDDVDAAARRVTAAGGKVLGAPVDIPTVGRMVRIADPTGAQLFLFRSSTGDPADVERRPAGHVDWCELVTIAPDRAVAFYEQAFGYTHETMEMPGSAYRILNKDGHARGGVMQVPKPGVPSQWLQYVVVDDADAACARATRHGGTVHMPPMDVPDIGRFAALADPFGATFGVIKPAR